MLAKKLGAKVGPHPEGYCEVGYYPVHPTELGERLCDCWPDHVYQWHREGFDVPAGAELLMEGDAWFPNQAFRYGGMAFALQFHPEVTTAMIHRWTVRAAEACWLDRFLDFWLALSPENRAERVA